VTVSRYSFRSAWTVDVDADQLFDVLSDIASYPRWWPQLRSVERIDDDTAAVECRSVLPYTLRLRAQRAREDRDSRILEVRLDGDLDGWSRWSMTPRQNGTALVFEQEVVVHGRVLRWVGLLGRPLLRLNHAWMMRGGRLGLDRWMSSRVG
jgi:ribosome-associated toxin RatA of RatAB toxin-antitoxin module